MMTHNLAIQRAQRDVYVSDFTVNGHHWVWSVDSRGEQVRLLTIKPDEDPAPKIAELWEELNRIDPLPTPVAVRSLRLISRAQDAFPPN